MRLYPPILILSRSVTLDNFHIGDQKIYKGDLIYGNILAMHRNEMYWPKSLEFIPERFLVIT